MAVAALLAFTTMTWSSPSASAEDPVLESLCDTEAFPAFGQGVDTAPGPDGNIWFTDIVSLGKITPSGHHTIYSRGFAGINFLGGITAGPDGNMWFTEQIPTGKVGKVSMDGDITEYTAGITADSRPADITAGPDGNLWFTEVAGNRIAKVTTAGVVTEYDLPAGAESPGAIVAGPDGNLWFAAGAGAIGRITTAGEITIFVDGLSEDSVPSGITVGPDGNLWFADANGRVGKVTPAGVITEYPVPKRPVDETHPDLAQLITHIVSAPDGTLWFNERLTGRIMRITTSGVISEVTTLESTFDLGGAIQVTLTRQPRALSVGADGNVWLIAGSDAGLVALGKVTMAGDFTAYLTGMLDPLAAGTAVGEDGRLWYGGLSAGMVGYVKTNGDADVWFVSGALTLSHIGGFALGPDGDPWFTETEGGRVVRMGPDGTVKNRFSAGISPGATPAGITRGADGNMWFLEPGIKKVARITPSGVVTEFGGLTETPTQIITGPDGNVWFTESNDEGLTAKIAKISPSGNVTEYDPGFAPEGGLVGGLVGGPDGNIWFTDVGGNRIGRMTPDGTVTFHGEGQFPAESAPFGITVSGDDLWIGLYNNGAVARMSTEGEVTLFDPTAPNLPDPQIPQMASAPFLHGDADGNLWMPGAAVRHATVPDTVGDPCDHDEDADAVSDFRDNCPTDANADQADLDSDELGDPCDPDDDNDLALDGADNCPLIANADQADADGDDIGDVCDREVVLTAGTGKTFTTVTATDSAGHPLAGTRITFKNRAGKTVCAAVTNASGRAKCPSWTPKAHSLYGGYKATYPGDTLHDPATLTTWIGASRR